MRSVLVLRHAQSEWNAGGRWQGQADPPLSEEGRQQARSAAAALSQLGAPQAIISSDLQRAVETARLLVPSSTPVELADLREYHVGDWSGLTRSEVEAGWPSELARFDEGRLARVPGGEDRDDFDRRVDRGVREAIAGSADADRVLIVTHGGVIRSLGRRQGLPERHIGHLAGFEAEVKGGGLVLHSFLSLLRLVAPGTAQRPSDGEI